MELSCLFFDEIFRLIDRERMILSLCKVWNRRQVFAEPTFHRFRDCSERATFDAMSASG